MAKVDLTKPVVCPHCDQEIIMEDLDPATKWLNRPDMAAHPRVRCPICSASFRESALREHLAKK